MLKKYIVLSIVALVALSSCSNNPPPPELKSPCVSAPSGDLESTNPCIRRPVNQYFASL